MKQRKLLLPIFAVVLTLVASLVAGASQKQPTPTWMGIYMSGQKMGYMSLVVAKDKYRGRDANRIESFVRTKLVLMRVNVQQEIRTTTFTDERYSPFFETFETSSGGRKTTVEATFTAKDVRCRVITDSSTSSKVVPIPDGTSLIGDSMYALGAERLKVGQKARMAYFNPLALSVDPVDVEVMREEQIEINGRKYDTFVVRNTTPTGDIMAWQKADGSLVKTEALLGVTMQIETEAEAKAGVDSNYVPPTDLAVVTSVRANIDIPKPRVTRKLTVKLIGKIDTRMAISDGWQTVTWLDPAEGKSVAQFKIESKPFVLGDSLQFPITAPELAPYLRATPYLDVDSPEIMAKAAEIVGVDKSAYSAALKIRAWVSDNMKPRADMGVVRPAADVLKEKSGVCRDYAVLFASLARASGVPTKVIAGLVYINGGFYYHAWNECYVGRWVAFDATLGRDFVDATHIKLAEGDATNMFDLATVFGSLKADIIDFR